MFLAFCGWIGVAAEGLDVFAAPGEEGEDEEGRRDDADKGQVPLAAQEHL